MWPWHQFVILGFGLSGVAMALHPRLQRYACFAGLAGQVGWFAAVSPSSQPGIWWSCVAYCLVWAWGLWLHWIGPWLDTILTPTVGPTAGLRSGSSGAASSKPRLRRVK